MSEANQQVTLELPAPKVRAKKAAKTLTVVTDQAHIPGASVPAPVAQEKPGSNTFAMIERMALDPSISIERAEQAFAFFQKVQADQAKREFVAAFAAAQADMQPVAKDANNPQTKSKYASLAALDRAIRPIYTKNGFSVSFDAADSPLPDHVRVVCFLAHISGHERTYHIDMACDGKGAKGGDVMTKTHAMGSAFSYGKRYLLGNVWNISSSEKDDDGNAATEHDALITEAQLNELIALADEVQANKAAFCKYYKIESFADITQRNFEAAKTALNAKRKGG